MLKLVSRTIWSLLSLVLLATPLVFSDARKAYAVTAGVTCTRGFDANNTTNGTFGDNVGIITLATNTCSTGNTLSLLPTSFPTSGAPIQLLLNTQSAGVPGDLDGLRLRHFSTVSNVSVSVNGAAATPVTGGEADFPVATQTQFTVQYDFGGDTLNFTATATPDDGSSNANTLSAFTIQAVAAGPPTAAITTDSGGSFNASAPGTFTATVTFSGPVTGFIDGELTATNASVGTLSPAGGSGTVFTATVTPDGNGDVALDVAADVAQDALSNDNTAAPQVTVTQTDDVEPTVDILNAPATHDGVAPFNVTVEFSEDVSNFVQTDVSVGDGAITGFTAVDGNTFTVQITPTIGNDVTIDIAANVAEDGAGNDNTAATQVTVTDASDQIAPTVDILNAPATHDGVAPFNVTVEFSEDVSNFVQTDVSVGDGAITGFTAVDGNTFTVQITPTIGNDVTIDIAANVAEDGAGNDNTAATQVTVTDASDQIAPTVDILNAPATHDGVAPFNVTVEFSEDVSNFVQTDVSVGDGAITGFTAVDGNTFTVQITPTIGNDVTIDVAANVAEDGAGNDNTAATQVTVTDASDQIAPTVDILNAPATHDGVAPFNVTVEFSEDVSNFVQTDVSVGDGAITGFTAVDGNTFTVQITPTIGNDVTIDVAANVAEDGAGNDNTAATQVTVTDASDQIAPTVEILGAPAQHDQSTPFNVTVEFSEDVLNFVAGDITAANATLSNFVAVDGNTFTVDVTPGGPQAITLDVLADVAQDAAGNNNLAADQVTIESNIVEQTQAVIASFLTSRANNIVSSGPDISGFFTGSNIGGGGQLGNLNLQADSQSQTFAFSTSLSRIKKGLKSVSAQNNNTNQVATQVATIAQSGFNKPGFSQSGQADFDRRFGSNGSNGNVADQRLAFEKSDDQETPFNPLFANNLGDAAQDAASTNDNSASRAGTFDVWTQISGSRATTDTSQSVLGIGYLGAHYFVNDNLLVGLLGQVDIADEDTGALNASADGVGWLVGPYVAGKLQNHPLFWEVRAAAGTSSNNVSPIGTFEDEFDTTRFLTSGKLSGQFTFNSLIVKPAAQISYFDETQDAYTDSLGNLIPETNVTLGEFRFGAGVGRSILVDDIYDLRLSVELNGIYNFAIQDAITSQGFQLGNDDLRARIDAKLDLLKHQGFSLSVSGYYDGIGVSTFESYGGSLRLVVPF